MAVLWASPAGDSYVAGICLRLSKQKGIFKLNLVWFCLQIVRRTGSNGDTSPEPVGETKQINNLVDVAYEKPEKRKKDGEDDGNDGGALLKV